MEIKKSKLDKLRDKVEVLTLRVRRFQSKVYLLWFLEIVLMYVLLFGLALIVDTTPHYLSTKVGSEFIFDSSRFELVERKVSLKNRELTFSLAEKNMENETVPVKWTVKTAYQNEEKTTEKIQLLTGEQHYLYAHISNLPDNWSAIRVTVTMAKGTTKTSQQFLVSREDVSEETSSLLAKSEVEERSIDHMIGLRFTAIEGAKKEIESANQSSKEAESQARELEKNLAYETEKQQSETKGTITQLKGHVQQNNQTIQQQERIIHEYQEQIENLKLKKKSVKTS